MSRQRPTRINMAIGLLSLRIAVSVLVIIGFYVAKDRPASEQSFLSGFRDAIIDNYNIDTSNPAYGLGQLIGHQLFPIVLSSLAIVFILKRKFWPTVVVVILDVLFGISKGLPLLSIVVLIIILTERGKNYLKRKEEKETSEAIDDQLR